MRTFFLTTGVLILFVVLLAGTFFYVFFVSVLDSSQNFKITVVVETPSGLKSGSGIWTLKPAKTDPRARRMGYDLFYHPIAIELSKGRNLFLVKDLDFLGEIFAEMKRQSVFRMLTKSQLMTEAQYLNFDMTMNAESWPYFLYFRNSHSIRSAKIIKTPNSFKAFGDRHKVVSVRVETTDLERTVPRIPFWKRMTNESSGNRTLKIVRSMGGKSLELSMYLSRSMGRKSDN